MTHTNTKSSEFDTKLKTIVSASKSFDIRPKNFLKVSKTSTLANLAKYGRGILEGGKYDNIVLYGQGQLIPKTIRTAEFLVNEFTPPLKKTIGISKQKLSSTKKNNQSLENDFQPSIEIILSLSK